MPKIRQLPPNLVNQIAAGEVIERPASVVKELLENSIDAGAHRIEVSIAGGGSELIRVADDGCGMTVDELPLAISSHATSKLPDDESLFHVQTLGFRGEAIASIASVSHLTIRSRTEACDGGSEIVVRGGAVEAPAPCGCPVGTVIEVRNLFFNTPVRHRFMRSAQTENGHIVEAFTRLALANPHVHMVLRSGERTLYDLPPTTQWSQRITSFFGDEIGQSLIRIDSDDAEVKVSGYVCDPSVSRGNARMQYLFLNGRHIRDRALQHALGEAYRGLLMVGRYPVCFMQLSMPPELVDVNVHPTKLEVRFTDSGRVYARLLQTLRHHFLSTDMTMRVGPAARAQAELGAEDATQGFTSSSVTATLPPAESLHRQSVIQWARTGHDETRHSLPGSTPEFRPFPGATSPLSGLAHGHQNFTHRDNSDHGFTSRDSGSGGSASRDIAPWEQDVAPESRDDSASSMIETRADGPHSSQNTSSQAAPSHEHGNSLGFQIHNRYLVTQDEAGMVIIDQHALHERVMYERIREKVLGGEGRLETQRMLVPEPVSLTPAERSVALESKELLMRIGIEIDDFGGDTILISGYPAMLGKTPPGDLLRQSLESIMAAGKQPEARDILDSLLHQISCKAAIKAGDRLTPEEISSLLEQRELYQDTHHCPHGRPTALFFSRDELDRMFGRLGPRGRS